MNDNEFQSIMEDEKSKLDLINREAWKYESFYRYQVPFSIKSIQSLFIIKWFRKKQQCVPCCNC